MNQCVNCFRTIRDSNSSKQTIFHNTRVVCSKRYSSGGFVQLRKLCRNFQHTGSFGATFKYAKNIINSRKVCTTQVTHEWRNQRWGPTDSYPHSAFNTRSKNHASIHYSHPWIQHLTFTAQCNHAYNYCIHYHTCYPANHSNVHFLFSHAFF